MSVTRRSKETFFQQDAPSPSRLGPAWLLALLSLGLMGAECGESRVFGLAPSFVLEPNRLDFGTVDVTQQVVRTFLLQNIGTLEGAVESVGIKDDCGGCFVVTSLPDVISAGQGEPLGIRFRAVRVEAATATVTVTVAGTGQVVEGFVRGDGSDSRRPDVVVVPSSVNFGFVPAGGVAVGSFAVRSVGQLNLLVDRITIEPPDAPFVIRTSTPTPESPGILAPGSSASVGLRVEVPTTETGTRTATVRIETNVLEEKNVPGEPGVVAVLLTALGNFPPVAVVGDNLVVEPFTQVELDGSGSFDPDEPPDLPLSYDWSIVSTPPGARPEFLGSQSARPVFRPDLAGRYELELVVSDAIGLDSEPARLVVDAFPDEAIRIELIWDHPDADLDLHVIRQSGTFCDCATDAHFRNCARQPNWFPERPGANPSLDVDDRNGFGPENINFAGDGQSKIVPADAFTIAVHYYSDASEVSTWPTNETRATIRIFVYGLLTAEATGVLENELEVWTAGTLQWPENEFVLNGNIEGEQTCGATSGD